MTKIVSVDEMRRIERASDAAGWSYDQMMEAAGRGVAEEILRRIGQPSGKRIAILTGSGNNGGDGLVAGRILAEAGATVGAYLAKPRREDDVHVARLRKAGQLVAVLGEDQRQRVLKNLLATADVVLDAVYGTGLELPLRGEGKALLVAAGAALAARAPRPLVVAVDCPSGLDCDGGDVAGEVLRADATVTLAAVKPGLLHFPGAGYVGDIVVAGIGLPAGLKEMEGIQVEYVTAEEAGRWLPPRPRDSHKGTFGQALVVAGSTNYPGAAALAAKAACRVGAGLVTLAVAAPVQSLLVPLLPEATWIVLPHELGVLSGDAAHVLRREMRGADAMLVGPGFGLEEATGEFVARLFGGEDGGRGGGIGFVHAGGAGGEVQAGMPRIVADADGLKLLGRLPRWYASLPQRSVLTPHPGEMSILTGMSIAEIQADRVACAKRWSAEWGHVVVLKGAFTVVAEPGGRVRVMPFATAALAHAGTGDVLAGAIVGFLAQGLEPFDAASLGAYVHGRAGELAAAALGSTAGVLAGDVGQALIGAIAELERAGSARV
jgi:NAD(P)H-hydrate epimerase